MPENRAARQSGSRLKVRWPAGQYQRATRVPGGETPFSYLEKLCHDGVRGRYHPITPRVLKQMAHEHDFQVLYLTCSDRFDAVADELVVVRVRRVVIAAGDEDRHGQTGEPSAAIVHSPRWRRRSGCVSSAREEAYTMRRPSGRNSC